MGGVVWLFTYCSSQLGLWVLFPHPGGSSSSVLVKATDHPVYLFLLGNLFVHQEGGQCHWYDPSCESTPLKMDIHYIFISSMVNRAEGGVYLLCRRISPISGSRTILQGGIVHREGLHLQPIRHYVESTVCFHIFHTHHPSLHMMQSYLSGARWVANLMSRRRHVSAKIRTFRMIYWKVGLGIHHRRSSNHWSK